MNIKEVVIAAIEECNSKGSDQNFGYYKEGNFHACGSSKSNRFSNSGLHAHFLKNDAVILGISRKTAIKVAEALGEAVEFKYI